MRSEDGSTRRPRAAVGVVMPDGDDAAFGQLLRRQRLAARLTQEQLARQAQLSVRAIQSLERGDRHPYPQTTERLRQALGMAGAADAAFVAAARPNSRHPTQPGPATPPNNNVPLQTSSFIGRQPEIADVTARLSSSRLLTVTGVGGSGKTRLALEVACRLLASTQLDLIGDGAWLVELATVADPALVPMAVASSLGLREQKGEPLARTLARSIGRQRLVLVLDNCEHVRAACAALVSALLSACPNLRILATSRQSLSIAGEVVYPLGALSVPPRDAEPGSLMQYPASQLFLERAAGITPRIDLTSLSSTAAVVRICRQLDGLPLALELAATRVSSLGVAQIAERLDRRFQLLAAGSPAAPPRHQTLWATIAWSYDLLDPAEAALFRRLAVFAGGWSLDAAEAVCGDDPHDFAASCSVVLQRSQVMPLLLHLVDRCLVVADVHADGSARYRLLDTVHAFVRECSAPSTETRTVRQRHVAFYAALADDSGGAIDGGDSNLEWLDRLEVDQDNLLVALGWAVQWRDLECAWRLGAALARASVWRGYAGVAQHHLAPLMALPRDRCSTITQLRALECEAELASHQADYALAVARHTQHLGVCRRIGDPRRTLAALCELAHALRDAGDYARAQVYLDESLTLGRQVGDRRRIAVTLDLMGTVAQAKGDTTAAQARYEDSLTIARELGDPLLLAWTPFNLGCLALDVGELERAGRLLVESLAIWRSRRATDGLVHALAALASLASAKGTPAQALRIGGATSRLSETSGCPVAPFYRVRFEQSLAKLRTQLGNAAADRIWAEGLSLGLDEAVSAASAIRHDSAYRGLDAKSSTLTRREREVVCLVAAGCSNRDIGSQLRIAEGTARVHVERILAKLDLHSRVQLAVWAIRNGE
jgi:non-specific serine/threonine protein kinase